MATAKDLWAARKELFAPAKDLLPPAKDLLPPAKDLLPPAKDLWAAREDQWARAEDLRARAKGLERGSAKDLMRARTARRLPLWRTSVKRESATPRARPAGRGPGGNEGKNPWQNTAFR